MDKPTHGNIACVHAVTVDGKIPNVVKKAFSKQLDFWDTFKPVYYFSRAFGLLPFSIGRDSNGIIYKPKVNTFDGIWFLFTIVAFLSAAVLSQHYMKFQDLTTQIYISIVLKNIQITLSSIFGILLIGMDMYNRFKIFEILKRFITFDNEVSYFSFNFLD